MYIIIGLLFLAVGFVYVLDVTLFYRLPGKINYLIVVLFFVFLMFLAIGVTRDMHTTWLAFTFVISGMLRVRYRKDRTKVNPKQ